jgi:uncharacterized protein YjiS (DUF1127 family)
MQANTIVTRPHTGGTIGGRLFAAIHAMIERRLEAAEKRRTVSALARLDPHALADIGLDHNLELHRLVQKERRRLTFMALDREHLPF